MKIFIKENSAYTKLKKYFAPHNMAMETKKGIKKIGIECHNLEGKRFGVGQTLIQLLNEISKRPCLQEKFEFYLYFKKEIPNDEALNASIFKKKILRAPLFPASFNMFYHILIPIRYFKDKLDGFFFPGYMLPAFFRGKSVVVLTNDLWYEIQKGSLPFQYRAAYKIFSWWAAKRASIILTLSETAKKEISAWYKIPPKKISVNPWGLNKNLASFSVSDIEIERIKEKYGIEKDFIFSWGQAFPRRHYKETILAFGKIAKKFPGLQYFLASSDKYNPPILKKLTEEINRKEGREAIIYRDYIENENDLFALAKAAKLVPYISTSEAMGLPPLEALALGTPGLVADNELNREIYSNNIFKVKDPDNADEISEKIDFALSNEQARREIINNRKAIIEKISWNSSLDNLIKIFNKNF